MPREKRTQTQIEKYGFKDNELTTPGHDAICMWIEDNIQSILSHLLGINEYLSEAQIQRVLRQYETVKQHILTRSFAKTIPHDQEISCQKEILESLKTYKLPPISNIKVGWEPALRNSREFEVGFLDMVATCKVPVAGCSGSEVEDLVVTSGYEKRRIWFEAKTKISSLGELFRQLSFYRNYIKNDTLVVVSNDMKYKDRIIQQGYHFLEPTLEEKKEKEKTVLFPTMRQ